MQGFKRFAWILCIMFYRQKVSIETAFLKIFFTNIAYYNGTCYAMNDGRNVEECVTDVPVTTHIDLYIDL